jgi:hypothetical protein
LALFDRRLVVRIQDRVDHPDQRTELGRSIDFVPSRWDANSAVIGVTC